jgi:hypothetical protein
MSQRVQLCLGAKFFKQLVNVSAEFSLVGVEWKQLLAFPQDFLRILPDKPAQVLACFPSFLSLAIPQGTKFSRRSKGGWHD